MSWLIPDPDLPQITLPELVNPTALQVDEALFSQWVARGLIPVRQGKVGRGKVRRYSFCEAVHASTMGWLYQTGLPLALTSAIGAVVAQRVRDAVKAGRNWDEDGDWQFIVLQTQKLADGTVEIVHQRFVHARQLVGKILHGAFGIVFAVDELIFRAANDLGFPTPGTLEWAQQLEQVRLAAEVEAREKVSRRGKRSKR